MDGIFALTAVLSARTEWRQASSESREGMGMPESKAHPGKIRFGAYELGEAARRGRLARKPVLALVARWHLRGLGAEPQQVGQKATRSPAQIRRRASLSGNRVAAGVPVSGGSGDRGAQRTTERGGQAIQNRRGGRQGPSCDGGEESRLRSELVPSCRETGIRAARQRSGT